MSSAPKQKEKGHVSMALFFLLALLIAARSIAVRLCQNLLQYFLQLAALIHLGHDVRAADEFAVDV